ncbi:MAG: hypothetical protein AAGD43_29610, partial [Pseudomonadota bacterium]
DVPNKQKNVAGLLDKACQKASEINWVPELCVCELWTSARAIATGSHFAQAGLFAQLALPFALPGLAPQL